jgi:hypothetical protein
MLSVFGSDCRCKQLFSLTKNVKSRTPGETTTETKPVINSLFKQEQC